MKTKNLVFTAISAALSVVLLYLASVLPTGRLTLLAVASVVTAVTVVRCGVAYGFGLYVAVSLLALLLLPQKGIAVFYIVFFGHYGAVKSVIESINKFWPEWVLKIVVFNVCAGALYFIWQLIFSVKLPVSLLWLFALGNIVFIIYDVVFTGFIYFIIKRIK